MFPTRRSLSTETCPAGFVDARDELDAILEFSAFEGPVPVPEEVRANLRVALDYFVSSNAPSLDPTPTSSPLPAPLPLSSTPPAILPLPQVDVAITRKITVQKLYTYSVLAHVEYPETCAEGSVGHLFELNPLSWVHPRENICYSQGAPMGQTIASKPVFCQVLKDSDGNLVPCTKSHSTCQGSKACPKAATLALCHPHTQANREMLKERLILDRTVRAMSASDARALLERTLAYIHALLKRGCGAQLHEATHLSPEERQEHEDRLEHETRSRRGYLPSDQLCEGRLLFNFDSKGDGFISCEHYSRTSNRIHFLDYAPSNGALDCDYIEAYFSNDFDEVSRIENTARDHGYGPLAPCATVANFSSQRLVCPCDHRNEEGQLRSLEMVHLRCSSKFSIWTPLPEYQKSCPYVLIVCSGEHRHPVPLPTTTPPLIKHEVFDMLRSLDQDLPDATPRRVMRHSVVIARLRQLLPDVRDPTLSDLHASLANKDRLRSYIKTIKLECFPHGTDWEGALHLHAMQSSLPDKEYYVRFVGTYLKSDTERIMTADERAEESGDTYQLVVCMTPENSRKLLRAEYVQSDIAFRRVVGYREFELVGWDAENNTSHQSAVAHMLIFQRIEAIVQQDTGDTLSWRHLHSASLDRPVGIKLITVDQHLGQAKGLGLYLKQRAQAPELHGIYDLHEPDRLLSDLNEYEHLHRVLRICHVHIYRNIKSSKVPEPVKNIMRGLVCTQHEDWDGALEEIRTQGGKVGQDWVQDKINSKFAFEGFCWEKSYIPIAVWQASDRHTNLAETSHADVNREGTGCTLVGGIVKGRQFDTLKQKSVAVLKDTGIRPSYMSGAESERMVKNIKRQQNSRFKGFSTADARIEAANEAVARTARAVQLSQARVEGLTHPNPQPSKRRRVSKARGLEEAWRGHEKACTAHAKALVASRDQVHTGSGRVNLAFQDTTYPAGISDVPGGSIPPQASTGAQAYTTALGMELSN